MALPKAQRAAHAAERLHAGNQWTDYGLVFTTEMGGPVDPRNLLRVVEVAATTRGHGKRRRAHPAALRGGRVARIRRRHQGSRRSARALVGHDHRRQANLAGETSRGVGDFEYQMLYGIRDAELRRFADAGNGVRVYLPLGTQWYGYFVRLAERPANLTFFLRALAERDRRR